ncbi:hypothetical protein CXF85_02825 [Colwellia sp. 75C3]|uniref:hypothetical protein n=1 Tax=Colwellia sp. 75C3 TaxID=888425 RepID=UPI000C333B04|nr:hypothetical protein [Colwellia sp. 75C3]PKG85740.1 hypothetical protein CXF85_02825 [Colwellia sp. 75C3]
MIKDAFFRKNGQPIPTKNIELEEDGLFVPMYEEFQEILAQLNSSENFSIDGIDFKLLLKWEFNAHAKKFGNNQYLIAIRSGVVGQVLTLMKESSSYFTKRYKHFLEVEPPVVFGCTLIWMQLFGHELGHIMRGHLELQKSGEMNLLDEAPTESLFLDIPDDLYDNSNELQFLIEMDADNFSATFVGQQLLKLIDKSLEQDCFDIEELVDLCVSSILIFFIFVSEQSALTDRYPNPLTRAETVISSVFLFIDGKTPLSKYQLDNIKSIALKETLSAFMVNLGSVKFLKDDSIDHWMDSSVKAEQKYPEFCRYLSEKSIVLR